MTNNFTANGTNITNSIVPRVDAALMPAGAYTGNSSALTGAYPLGGSGSTGNANFYGSLGDGTVTTRSTTVPVFIGQAGSWQSVYASAGSSFGIKPDGTLWAWGLATYGQLGLGNTSTYSSPAQVGSLTTWSKLAASPYHTMAIKTDGTLWGWGNNSSGQLGDGTVVSKSSPVQVGVATTWVTVAAGSGSTIAAQSDGTLWGWGYNGNGVLGDPATVSQGVSNPMRISPLPTWSSASAGTSFVTAIKPDGTLWAWGAAASGVLGNGTASPNISSPVQIGSLTTWSKISSGTATTVAVKSDGTLWAWGGNGVGQLGDGTITARNIPTQEATLATNWAMAVTNAALIANATSYGIKTDGTLWSWGYSGNGALGNSTTTPNKSTPVQITGTSWATVSAGNQYALAVKTNGSLWAWGFATSGGLGNSSTTATTSSPIQIGSLTDWSKVAAGSANSSLAVKTDGTLWAWGANASGTLGLGDVTVRSSPVQVGALTNWANVCVSAATTLAVKTDGTLWAWGNGAGGMFGNNAAISRSSPAQVGSESDWASVSSTDGAFVVATKTDNTLWAWGANASGQLGTFAVTGLSLPVQTGTLQKWTFLEVTRETAHGIKDNGTLWGWGDNSYGMIGDNTLVNKSSPVQIGILNDWKTINGFVWENGAPSVVALKTTGLMYSWGDNSSGQLGLGSLASKSSPNIVGSLTSWNWVSATMGAAMLSAVASDGTLWQCGSNATGTSALVQVGSKTTWTSVASGGTYYATPYYLGLSKF